MTMAPCPGCMGTGLHNWVPGYCEHATDQLGHADPDPDFPPGWPAPIEALLDEDDMAIIQEDLLENTVQYPASHETKELIFRSVNYEEGIACSECPYEDNTCQIGGCEQQVIFLSDLMEPGLKWPDDFRGFGTNVKPKGQK